MSKAPHTYLVPSNFEQIKKLRQNTALTLNECKYVAATTKLRDYQTIGTLNVAMMLRTILGDDPGLGKTIQALVAYAILKSKDPELKLLVITTKSAIRQWGKEINKFLTGLSYHVMVNEYRPINGGKKEHGSKARLLQYEELKYKDIFICGYYPVSEEYTKLAESRGERFMVVYDECQAFKNDDTKVFIGAEYIAQKAIRVYGLTATPIKNKLTEFYNIFKVIVPGLFPRVTAFKDQFTVQEMKMVPQRGGRPRMIKQVVDYKNLDQFRSVIEPYFLKRFAHEVAKDLPRIVAKRIEVEMGPVQKKVYAEALAGIIYEKKIRQKYFEIKEKLEATENPSDKLLEEASRLQEKYDEVLSGDYLTKNKSSALVFCQLVANGPAWVGEEGPSAKEEAFQDLFEGELYGNKVIVYTRFKSGIPRLSAILDKLDIKWVRVTGDENDKEREKAMDTFQDKDSGIDVILITSAGSAAINLQTSGIELFYDSPWSFGDLVQIIGRARRIGSEHESVLTYHMTTVGTIDDRVIEVLRAKKKLSDTVVGEQAQGTLIFDGEEYIVDNSLLDERSEQDILFDEIFGKKH